MGEIINYVVVDDEPAAHIVFSSIMKKYQDFRLAGSYFSGESAIAELKNSPPDLIFLDFSMPGISGLDLLKMIDNPVVTVLTTAHSGYALNAYDFGVRDYLLKPISQERLDICIDRLRPILSNSKSAAKYLAFSVGHSFRMIHPSEIFAFEANGNFSRLITIDDEILISESLRSIEERLNPFGFIRIHKRYVINIDQINQVSKINIIMNNGSLYPIGASYKHQFFRKTRLI